jgi:hypothetical protein
LRFFRLPFKYNIYNIIIYEKLRTNKIRGVMGV